ncbi:Uncharacterised protein [uncultured Ruminococcus sp.]|uniref:DUF6688 domain-containing protein n=1 Tax=Huintestinicola butyrica TaxID=2981728 RepID=UPI0008223D5F|nr:DUF6688 family protein [Huintestinicola butyrica]MCU6728555.1 hypothetical protein [Huintestinicola butyrica]SCJ18249.1 Uncharacterised protein [uncultured Ruminococcus sp.]
MYYVNNIINTIVGFIFLAILFTVTFAMPAVMTIWNIISLTPKKDMIKHRRRKDIATLLLGLLLTIIMLGLMSSYHWDEPVIIGGDFFSILHEPFSSDYALSLLLYAAVPIACMIIAGQDKLLPPLAGAFCIGGIYGGMVLCFFYTSHLLGGLFERKFVVVYLAFLFIYVLNYFLMAVRIISGNVKRYLAYFRENDIHPNSALGVWAVNVLSKASGWVWFPVICLIPLTGLLICICILFGQGPWGIIKAFTETSDWTYSTMISPPPEHYTGHYLCTVAVNGHEKLVKPTRLGIRQGVKIGVNRQLCVANAFEQVIEERTPRFHRLVRYIYDNYGYPLSKHITTKLRADIIYIVMKPLEWIFLAVLYLSDICPESRIAVQYTGRKMNDFSIKE